MEPRNLRPMHYESSAWDFLQPDSAINGFGMEDNMKEKWSNFKASLTEMTTMSRKEFLLTIAVCVLGGIVFGILASPKKSMVIGSNNGNNSGNYSKAEEEKDEIADRNEMEEGGMN